MSAATLFIAAGHGGTDPGNTSTEFIERDEVITVVDIMERWYRATAEPVKINEVGGIIFIDHRHALPGEIQAIEAWKPDAGDLGINVHLDFKKNNSGALILTDDAPLSKAFSELFLPQWCAMTHIKNNGVWDSKQAAKAWRGWPDYGFCARTWPGIILELGCLSSPADMKCVRDRLNQCLLAHLIWKTWEEVKG